MTIIRIEKHDNAFLRIFSDPSTEQELSEFFSFRVDGYKFMPSYRSGRWDGFARLYNLQKKTLYVGLLNYVKKFAERNQYTIECNSDIESETEITLDEVKEFVDWLNLSTRGNKIEVRDYQYDAIYQAIKQERILLQSPTSSGKSAIIYSVMRHHLEEKRKILIVVPTVSLVEQLYKDFDDYSANNGWKVNKHCQMIYSGFTKDCTHEVTISTWQSIYKQPKNWFQQFDVVFGDEAHLFKAESLTGILEKCSNATHRIACTGTLDGKVNILVIEGNFGPVYKVISTRELMDAGQVVDLNIKCILLKYDEVSRKMQNKNTYQAEMNFITGHYERNKFIRNLAISTKGTTLVLINYIERHGEVLFDMIKEKSDRKVFFIHGGTKIEEREFARELANNEDCIIVASIGVFSTGINLPAIEHIIMASPMKSKIRNLQSIGRGLRLKEGKTKCNLYDISDDLSHRSHTNHTLKHMASRIKIYSEERFNFKILEIDIE